MFNQSRQDQAPFRQAGLVGLNQYMNMLGLGGTQPAYGTQGNGGGSVGTYMGGAPSQSLVTVQNGVPTMNADLYNSDPAYARAWDQVVMEHQNQFGKPYQADSSSTAINARLQQLYQPPAPSNGVGNVGYETATPAHLPGTAGQVLGGGPSGNSQQDAFAAFRAAPGYQFGLDEGAKTVQASAAARGGLNSGATLKALTKFGNDYADQQGFTPYMNRLAALSGMAQTSTNQTNALGQNYANQVGNNLQNAGQARAQGIYGSANAWSNFGQQASSALGNAAGQGAFKNMFGPGTIGSGI